MAMCDSSYSVLLLLLPLGATAHLVLYPFLFATCFSFLLVHMLAIYPYLTLLLHAPGPPPSPTSPPPPPTHPPTLYVCCARLRACMGTATACPVTAALVL